MTTVEASGGVLRAHEPGALPQLPGTLRRDRAWPSGPRSPVVVRETRRGTIKADWNPSWPLARW